ncbi:uncharacterized protein B0H64DRAFT_325931 [Chaetomium fimeti]|uniref:Ras-GAP domain-containing protein n=1 Tax=Chaetomium fimeti TaxID=1854472 RepID=A0AAE0HEL4_9PEZI|nr:hypothetical protein B0H64DRAFT_325931 [Chaetomium fimeti]
MAPSLLLCQSARHAPRAVTPEPIESAFNGLDGAGSDASQVPRGFGSVSPQTSPRTIPTAGAGLPARRQGVVFHDAFPGSFDSASTSPPLRSNSFRPRTHTMDGAFRQQLAPTPETRNRMGSFSSAASFSVTDDMKLSSFQSPFESYKHADLQPPLAMPSSKDKKSSGPRSRLTKRPSSRPSSPLSSLPPSVDSLPLPIPTADANKVLILMKNLCGRMRGEVEYQKEVGGPWVGGMCYIEEERGSLMFDAGDSGPFHATLIPDLRGCRVVPVEHPDGGIPCLEVASVQLGVAHFLRPLVADELDLWLAALLCWQQLRPSGTKPQPGRPSNAAVGAPARMEMKRRASSSALRETAIIKVGKVLLWDKGAAISPRAIVRRPSTRDLRSSQTCWRRVSCILHDNGELKIMTENDVTVLSVIELSQLARSAIQQLDKSVLDEDYCLAIFPSYSSTSTQLSIFRPVYIALETRVLLEVWAVNTTEVLCGSVEIPLHQLDYGKDHEQWLQIHDDGQQSIGSMLIKVHHEEFVVLLQRNYQPISELLHRFSSGLIAQITEALPGSLRRLAEIFVNIFQVSGSANEWLMNMVEEEIDGIGNQTPKKKGRFSGRLKSNDSIESAVDREQVVRDLGKSLQGEANLLFRGNSLLTQALEFYMRRLGKEYLIDTLADRIQEINESDYCCEVDPSKVHHGEDIQQHWSHLVQFTTDIWDCIVSSTARLPPELRHILKYIRAVAEDRYGDFLRTVTYTSVSGFLFLRFLCPAILNPKLFGLLRDHPRPRAQRTLTLIAKSLQALANLSTIGKKETWMEPMNRFLTAQRQSFKDFLDEVCAIPVERTKAPLPPSYSTPITILGRLSPLAREGFPSLPYLVDQGRYFAALVKLWADAHRASASESQLYSGDLLNFHNLCIGLHQRAEDCLTRIEALRVADTASQPADDQATLSDVMDRISIGDMLTLSAYGGGGTAAWAENEDRAPGSSGSEMDAPPFGTISISRDARHGSFSRELSATGSLRQLPRNNNNSEAPAAQGGNGGNGGGTVRSLRSGIHPRKLLSGFIRKTRTTSPETLSAPGQQHATASASVVVPNREGERDREGDQEHAKESKGWERIREREREKERERERQKERDRDREREHEKGPVGLPEPRQVETVARAHTQGSS